MNLSVIEKTANHLKNHNIILPKISELANPLSISNEIQKKLKRIDKNAADPINLFRVHWHNNKDHSSFRETPEYVVLTRLISAIFRRSGDPMFILEELQGIFDPNGGSFREGKYYHSFYSEVADVIERFFCDVGIIEKPDKNPVADNGIVKEDIEPSNVNFNNNAFKHFKEADNLKNKHNNYNIQFVRTLISLDKFEEAIRFSKSVWSENESIFEIDLLIGLDYFVKKDYLMAEKYFERLNKVISKN